ncbi:hypothetical protein [Sinorhizobium fredii]|uniref:hypothetical protein n=1 Tax=Rhizobium fredii TaxID=380 RepID=UPI0035130923
MSFQPTATALLVLAVLVSQSSCKSTEPAKPSPAGLHGYTKTWGIPNKDILRDDGEVAVRLRNATFTLLYTEEKQVFLLDFDHFNRWQEGGVLLEELRVVGSDKMGKTYDLTKITYYSIMDRCYYGGRSYQVTSRMPAPPLIDVLEDVQFITVPIKGKIGKC